MQHDAPAVLILPIGPGAPVYRDQFVAPTPRVGLDALNIVSALRLPQVVLPSEYLLLRTIERELK